MLATNRLLEPPLLQAPQAGHPSGSFPESLHTALVHSLPHLAELSIPHLDHSEEPLGLVGLILETFHCCAQIEATPQIEADTLYSREADLDSEEPASNSVHRGELEKIGDSIRPASLF